NGTLGAISVPVRVFLCPSDPTTTTGLSAADLAVWGIGVVTVPLGNYQHIDGDGLSSFPSSHRGVLSAQYPSLGQKYPPFVNIVGITDGTSSTLLFGERYCYDPLWAQFAAREGSPTNNFVFNYGNLSGFDGVFGLHGNAGINYMIPQPAVPSPADP